MTRSKHSIAAALVAVVASGALAGPVAAATPGKRLDAKRATAPVQAPTSTTATARSYWGAPRSGAPGAATGGECRSYAAAANAIVDQIEQSVIEGTDLGYDADGVVNGILDAAQARGCAIGVTGG